MEFRMSPNIADRTAAFTDAADFYTKVIGFADRSDDPELADPGANPLNIFNMLKLKGDKDWRWSMSQHSKYLNKSLYIWIFTNILGFSALGLALLVFPSIMSVSGIFGSTLIISIPISLAQWIALRRIYPISILWILSIPISILLVILLIRELPDDLWQIFGNETADLILFFLLIGLIIGLPQWLLLRRQYSNSSIWLLGSSIGVGAGSGLVLATGLINQSGIISYIVAALFYAISTGLTLSILLANNNQLESSVVSAP